MANTKSDTMSDPDMRLEFKIRQLYHCRAVVKQMMNERNLQPVALSPLTSDQIQVAEHIAKVETARIEGEARVINEEIVTALENDVSRCGLELDRGQLLMSSQTLLSAIGSYIDAIRKSAIPVSIFESSRESVAQMIRRILYRIRDAAIGHEQVQDELESIAGAIVQVQRTIRQHPLSIRVDIGQIFHRVPTVEFPIDYCTNYGDGDSVQNLMLLNSRKEYCEFMVSFGRVRSMADRDKHLMPIGKSDKYISRYVEEYRDLLQKCEDKEGETMMDNVTDPYSTYLWYIHHSWNLCTAPITQPDASLIRSLIVISDVEYIVADLIRHRPRPWRNSCLWTLRFMKGILVDNVMELFQSDCAKLCSSYLTKPVIKSRSPFMKNLLEKSVDLMNETCRPLHSHVSVIMTDIVLFCLSTKILERIQHLSPRLGNRQTRLWLMGEMAMISTRTSRDGQIPRHRYGKEIVSRIDAIHEIWSYDDPAHLPILLKINLPDYKQWTRLLN